jgi:hypothetical protein
MQGRPAKIAVEQMPNVIFDIIRDVVCGENQAEIVASGLSADALAAVAHDELVDIIILSGEPGLDKFQSAASLLGAPRAPSKVITLLDGSRSAQLYEYRPHVTMINPLSADALRKAIRREATVSTGGA